MSKPTIGFVGLTHLGLVSAVAVASKGLPVIGFDGDAQCVKDIAAGKLQVVEPGLDELVQKSAGQIKFTSDGADLRSCDVVYISTDVPTDDRGHSDLAGIRASVNQVI